jgi:hypothetical protein
MKRRNPLSHEARELALFIENDGDLYRQQTTPIILNLARKIKRGIFSHVKAANLFRYLADNGAKKYSAEFGTPQSGVTRSNWRRYKGFDAFSTKIRQETAKHILRYYFQAIREKAGELKGKKNPIKQRRIYVGYGSGKKEIFFSDSSPTSFTHGHLYGAVIGPFRTLTAASLMASVHGPNIQTVADAERWARREKMNIRHK